MKKLLIAMGCITAIILTSSCSPDSIEEPRSSSTKYNQETILTRAIDSLSVTNYTELDNGDGNTDKTKT